MGSYVMRIEHLGQLAVVVLHPVPFVNYHVFPMQLEDKELQLFD